MSGHTIVVSGMIAGVPHQGGATWAVLQYLLGLRELGHDVYFIEPIKADAAQPRGCDLEASDNAAYFRSVMADFAFEGAASLLLAGTRQTVGLSYSHLQRVCLRAHVLINISGVLTDERLTGRIPVRAYLDLDPGFTQFWAAGEGIDMNFAGHTHFVTIGQAIGRDGCVVPTCGIEWIPTLQPVVLSRWPIADRITHDALTTIAHWRSYGSVTYQGVFYGQKAHALRQFVALPTLTGEKLALAIAIHPEETTDLAALAVNGWHLLDPADLTCNPSAYQTFIRESKAELGVAKSGYVTSRCGWFSDRSVCYLASGRPVIAADTGFRDVLPTGDGLLPFASTDELLAQIDALNTDYARHSRCAREIAEEYFESGKVLTGLLQRLDATV